ncbi:transcriptional repressor [Streptomyces sp. NBC_00829]|nr:transcriptional repressor [Streptomyces sp. NBC_00829]
MRRAGRVTASRVAPLKTARDGDPLGVEVIGSRVSDRVGCTSLPVAPPAARCGWIRTPRPTGPRAGRPVGETGRVLAPTSTERSVAPCLPASANRGFSTDEAEVIRWGCAPIYPATSCF